MGIPEDESVSIQNALVKRKEQEKKLEGLVRQNKILVEENLELKSDVRTAYLRAISINERDTIISHLDFI